MKNKKIFISGNLGGISNRMKCLVSVLRFSKDYNREILLYWPLNHTCGANFSDLFKNNMKEINEEELREIQKQNVRNFDAETLIIENSDDKYLGTGTWRFLLKKEELEKNPFLKNRRESNEKGIDLNFSDVPEEIKKEILTYLKKFKPLEEIQNKIDEFQKKHPLNKLIGIHMRRGDFADRKVSPGKVSSDQKFIEMMKNFIRQDPKTKFFLCTDSKETEEKFEKIFGERIVKYPKTSFSRTDVKATQEGLIDLILLSKTKHILGTYRSTFSEMAWWLGDCKPKIDIVIDPKKEKEYFKYARREKKKLIPKIKRTILKFIGRKFI